VTCVPLLQFFCFFYDHRYSNMVATRSQSRFDSETPAAQHPTDAAMSSPLTALSDFQQPRSEEDARPQRSSPEAEDIVNIRRKRILIEQRCKELEQLQRLQEEEQRLLETLRISKPAKRHRREDSSSDDDRYVKIDVKNIDKFTLKSSLRKREEWLNDLQRAFSGNPRKYRKSWARIVLAQEYMDSECRNRWKRHVETMSTSDPQAHDPDWDYFQEFTKTLVRDARFREPNVMEQLVNAKQRDNQDPQDFDAYLDSLEKEFEPRGEKERALEFFSKPSRIRSERTSANSPTREPPWSRWRIDTGSPYESRRTDNRATSDLATGRPRRPEGLDVPRDRSGRSNGREALIRTVSGKPTRPIDRAANSKGLLGRTTWAEMASLSAATIARASTICPSIAPTHLRREKLGLGKSVHGYRAYRG
jgi:hypothetical protein